MTETIYERYKEALKAGHVAVLRGRLEEALGHYREAASLADERALPHIGLAGVLLRLGRIDEALTAYARALGRSPRDEAALAGRADALIAAGRPAEAAELLDRLSDVLQKSGRAAEALRAVRRALEFGTTRRRRQRERRLARLVEPGTSLPEAAGAGKGPVAAATSPAEPEAEEAVLPLSEEDELAEAEAAAHRGERAGVVDRFFAVAERYLVRGAIDAALDACQRALEVSPGEPRLHLLYVRLYLAAGWRERAAEKLRLLQRLAALDGNEPAATSAAALAAEAFPGDLRFGPEPG